jgi:hypothetical protein
MLPARVVSRAAILAIGDKQKAKVNDLDQFTYPTDGVGISAD